MTAANVSYGVRCNRCGQSTGLLVNIGGQSGKCGCGGDLVADNQWTNMANVRCQCGTSIGMLVAAGGPPKCPGCGRTL